MSMERVLSHGTVVEAPPESPDGRCRYRSVPAYLPSDRIAGRLVDQAAALIEEANTTINPGDACPDEIKRGAAALLRAAAAILEGR